MNQLKLAASHGQARIGRKDRGWKNHSLRAIFRQI